MNFHSQMFGANFSVFNSCCLEKFTSSLHLSNSRAVALPKGTPLSMNRKQSQYRQHVE